LDRREQEGDEDADDGDDDEEFDEGEGPSGRRAFLGEAGSGSRAHGILMVCRERADRMNVRKNHENHR
jgi:hypothetical protein